MAKKADVDLQNAQILEGVKIISSLLKEIKIPADTHAKKELSESLKILRKKQKAMTKDTNLRIQYIDRVCFDTIQGVFQALHLYIISTKSDKMIEPVIKYLRKHENCYSIADRMKKAALARADFNDVPKK